MCMYVMQTGSTPFDTYTIEENPCDQTEAAIYAYFNGERYNLQPTIDGNRTIIAASGEPLYIFKFPESPPP